MADLGRQVHSVYGIFLESSDLIQGSILQREQTAAKPRAGVQIWTNYGARANMDIGHSMSGLQGSDSLELWLETIGVETHWQYCGLQVVGLENEFICVNYFQNWEQNTLIHRPSSQYLLWMSQSTKAWK